MKLIVGLGNPGEKYANTRHNCGYMAVDQLLKDLGDSNDNWSGNAKLKADTAMFSIATENGEEKVILAKPHTFMNESGVAVSLLMNFYKIASPDLWVVYDELDLPMGSLKIRKGGAAAGHHGVESVMEHAGTDAFWRFRMGIGQSHDRDHAVGRQVIHDAKDFVLGTFTQSEQGKAKDLIKHTAKALEAALKQSLDVAMNRFNTK